MFEIFQIDPTVIRLTGLLKDEGVRRLNACSYLGSPVLKDHALPALIFTDISQSGHLGYYDSTQNLIVISAALLDEGQAADNGLTDIYLHELAHYCDYVINGESAHDTAFREICRALNVRQEYSAAGIRQAAGDRQRIKSRIEKLLNLSESDFEGEATLAMEKARILMEKYGIQASREEDVLFGVHAETMKRHKTWKGTLAWRIAQTTGAFPLFDRNPQGLICLSFYGTREQVEVSLYMYDSLLGTIGQKCEEAVRSIREAQARRLSARKTRISRDQICQGLVDGFCKANVQVQSEALVMYQKDNESRFRRITRTRLAHRTRSYSATSQYEIGLSGGKTISMPSGGKMRKRIRQTQQKTPRNP